MRFIGPVIDSVDRGLYSDIYNSTFTQTPYIFLEVHSTVMYGDVL
jgi:hypothetical protein